MFFQYSGADPLLPSNPEGQSHTGVCDLIQSS